MGAARLIGLISDTHGLVRAEVMAALAGAELVVHAGDIGDPTVLDRLGNIAPVRAVRGNTDTEPWGRRLPRTLAVPVGRHQLYVVHDLGLLDLDPVAVGISAVISGHTHRPLAESRDGVWYVNPGSAGPQRTALPPTVARLWIDEERLTVDVVELDR